MVHFIAWKFIIIQMTEAATTGSAVDPIAIIECTKRRIRTRTQAIQQHIEEAKRKAEATGDIRKPKVSTYRKWIDGIGEIDDEGCVAYNNNFLELIQ